MFSEVSSLPTLAGTESPKNRLLTSLSMFLFLILQTGCQSAMPSSSNPPDRDSSGGSYSNFPAKWPLEFRAHYFGAHCFDTQECEIRYRGFPHGNMESASPSVASYGRPLEDLLSAGRGPIPNFPPPAEVTWRSRDGTFHAAEIDIGEIFKDQLIRHNVAREEASDPATDGMPAIIIEANDRTINVYMRATIWTKEEQIPGNKYSHSREDLIKVFSRTY